MLQIINNVFLGSSSRNDVLFDMFESLSIKESSLRCEGTFHALANTVLRRNPDITYNWLRNYSIHLHSVFAWTGRHDFATMGHSLQSVHPITELDAQQRQTKGSCNRSWRKLSQSWSSPAAFKLQKRLHRFLLRSTAHLAGHLANWPPGCPSTLEGKNHQALT